MLIVPNGDDDIVIAAVADGAGSAAYSHIGARTATEIACDRFAEHVSRLRGAAPAKADLLAIINETASAVCSEADARSEDPREFACTLLVMLLLPSATWSIHIGDGAMVVDDGELRVLSWPDQGEYANTTTFLTSPEASERTRIAEGERAIRFALFSDGLQNVALDYAAQTVFTPFLKPMLDAVSDPEADARKLETSLDKYLSSGAVNARTDDDKTLVLGARVDQ